MPAGTGCSASNLPFSYLGLPIGSNMNRISNWNSLIDRFKNRLSGWKANMLSSGGRLTLIKSVLGSLGIYYFSIFKVPEAVLKVLESLHALFFWGTTGVGSLKSFNNSLLLKWRWRLLNNPSALWVKVLKSIHGNEDGIELKGCQTNGLWARIVGTIYHLNSSGYVPLNSLRYLTWDWRRPINGGRALADLNNLLMDIGSLNVEVDRDCVVSSLSTNGSYSVSFIRKHIDNCMIANSLPCTRWCTIIPQKVNIFMWRMLLDKLPHRLNLSSRGLDIDSILCPVCSEHVESNSHAFFSCSAASNIWRLVRGWCELKIPTLSSCDKWDLWFTSWKASKDEKDRAYVIFAATCLAGILSCLLKWKITWLTYSDLCSRVPESKFSECLLTTLAIIFNLMCSYHAIMNFNFDQKIAKLSSLRKFLTKQSSGGSKKGINNKVLKENLEQIKRQIGLEHVEVLSAVDLDAAIKASCYSSLLKQSPPSARSPTSIFLTKEGKGLVPEHHLLTLPEHIRAFSVGYSLLLKKEKVLIVQPDCFVIRNGPTFGCILMKDFLQALAKRTMK
ncbi:RNA-directed DNA polymerase, eukaryota, reverse transcriptase zinc-binding domain protein [Tanacetum coccineum]